MMEMLEMMKGRCESRNFRQLSSGFRHRVFDKSFAGQIVDFTLSSLSLSLFHHYVNGACPSPRKTALKGRERPLTKVHDETHQLRTRS
jgi:hypothetical protein